MTATKEDQLIGTGAAIPLVPVPALHQHFNRLAQQTGIYLSLDFLLELFNLVFLEFTCIWEGVFSAALLNFCRPQKIPILILSCLILKTGSINFALETYEKKLPPAEPSGI